MEGILYCKINVGFMYLILKDRDWWFWGHLGNLSKIKRNVIQNNDILINAEINLYIYNLSLWFYI